MCGIAGIVSPHPRHRERLPAMLASLVHRGPDDQGWHTSDEDEVALGHRRLSIIDLEGGRQPLCNEDESLWLVCNGEIYNSPELRERLERKGHRFATRSDCEVIVHLYEELGDACVRELRGMFAFAIWDSRQRRLFAARDHMGQKPFFYHEFSGQGLAFGSEIKALLEAAPESRRLDPQALDQYLTLRFIGPPLSMFEGIRKLPPAHSLSYDATTHRLQIQRYWHLAFEPKWSLETPGGEAGEEALVDELEERLIEAVRLQTLSDVPVGAFLSGGLDSTLITAILMKHTGAAPVPTFTLGLPLEGYDEAPAAREVAERYGTHHYEERLVPSLIAHLPDLVHHLDEPADPLALCSYHVSSLASRHVKVALGGDGGDELFGGYDRYYGNLYADHYARLPGTLRRAITGPLLEALPEGRWYKSVGHQAKWIHQLSFLQGGARYARSLSYFYFSPGLRDRLYTRAFQDQLGAFDSEQVVRASYENALANHPIDRMLGADIETRMVDHPVMTSDRMSMAHGLETRSPFLDHKLAEFVARLPVAQKVRGRSLRWIQKRLAARYLPRTILERPKQGFASALPYLLRDEYVRLFRHFLRSPRLVEEGYLQRAPIERLVDEHVSGARDHGNRLWLLLNAEVWYRSCLDRVPATDLRALEGSGPTSRCFVPRRAWKDRV